MSLESFRKKFPQYDDIPDVELAEKLYDKYYSDLDETQYYSKMFPKIAKEKYDEADDIIVSPDDMMLGTTELDFISFKPTTAEIAKQAGIIGTPTVQLFKEKLLKKQWQGVKQRSEFRQAIKNIL